MEYALLDRGREAPWGFGDQDTEEGGNFQARVQWPKRVGLSPSSLVLPQRAPSNVTIFILAPRLSNFKICVFANNS